MMTAFEKVREVELRVKKAAVLIERQRLEIEDLKKTLALIQSHNEELEQYADTYRADEQLITQSIDSALDTLSAIEGLEDYRESLNIEEFDTAEQFGGGEALSLDDVSLQLPDFTPLELDADEIR